MKKYDLSLIMRRAWVIYRKHEHKLTWSDSLKQSWSVAKNVKILTFDQLYKRYKSEVFNFVISRVSDYEISEEITQDIFTKASNNIHRYDVNITTQRTWLYNISKRCVIDYWRKKKEHHARIDDNNDNNSHFEYAKSDNTGQRILERKEISNRVLSEISKLGERESQVVTMFYFENRKLKDIAEILGLSESNVKIIMFRSKDKLRNVLQGVYSEMV